MSRLAAASVLVMALIQCGPPEQSQRVGALLPLTGEAAAYGKEIRDGMELARQELAPALIIRYEDTRADPSQALSAYRKLHDVDSVTVFLGPFTSGEASAVIPAAESDSTFLLSMGASSPRLSGVSSSFMRIVSSDVFDGVVLARFTIDSLKCSDTVVLLNDSEYGQGVRDAYAAAAAGAGAFPITPIAYSGTTADFRPIALRIKRQSPACLLLVGYKEMGLAVRQLRGVGITIPIVSTGLFEDPDVLKSAGAAANGVYYSYAAFDPASTDSAVARFVARYTTTYGSAPSILGALGYDAVALLLHASSRRPKADSLRNQLLRMTEYLGATGRLKFAANGDVLKPFGIKRIQEGQPVWLTKSLPEE